MAASLTNPKPIPGFRGVGGPRVKPYTGNIAADVKMMRVLVGVLAPAEVQVDNTGVYQIIQVPAGLFVAALAARIITAFTAAVTITIGDGVAAAGFAASAKLAPTVADTAGLYKNTAVITADAYAGGIKYLVADTIDVTIGGAVPLVGLMEVIITYSNQLFGTT